MILFDAVDRLEDFGSTQKATGPLAIRRFIIRVDGIRDRADNGDAIAAYARIGAGSTATAAATAAGAGAVADDGAVAVAPNAAARRGCTAARGARPIEIDVVQNNGRIGVIQTVQISGHVEGIVGRAVVGQL